MILTNSATFLLQEKDWALLRHFTKTEKWGDWRKVHRKLAFVLDAMRQYAGRPVILHNVYDSDGHSDGSYHYDGMAADWDIPGLPVIDQFIIACRFGFGGIGIYPHWNSPGIHTDIRPLANEFTPESRWLHDRDGKYIPLTWSNILKECQK